MKHRLINGDCLEVLRQDKTQYSAAFCDPPDNIGLGYDAYHDRLSEDAYRKLLNDWTVAFMRVAPVVWMSFNARWTFAYGGIVDAILGLNPDWEAKPCVQVFTFGQNNKYDLGNNHRPLWRLKHKDAPLYPDAIKVPSWRERNGDKRAKPGGRVPGDVFDMQYPIRETTTLDRAMDWCYRHNIPESQADELESLFGPHPGDVFDFPRVTGNSKQRCDWHPTQLHEELVERALRLTTKEGDTVLDPFGGTGTTLRVCKKIGRDCTLIELDPGYCAKLREIHPELRLKKIAA
jgi:DNA modification methylase